MTKTVYRTSYLYYFTVEVGFKPVCTSAFLSSSDQKALSVAREECKELSGPVCLYRFARILEYVDSCSVCSDFKYLGKVN